MSNRCTNRFTPVALAAAFLFAVPAFAQQANDTDEQDNKEKQTQAAESSLPTVEVRASAMQTTTGMDLSVRQTPQSVTVVSKPVLREQGITNMADAMRATTGVNVIRDTGRVRFQSRGFYVDQIQEDGISSTVPGSSSNPTRDAQSMTDLAVYDHIEVVRGPTGLTQANGEPGGTINAVRKKPTSNRQISVELQGDRWGQARAVVDASNSLNADKTIRGRFVGVAERLDTFVDRTEGSKGTLYGVMDFQLGNATVLTAGAMYQRINETPDYYGVPMIEPQSNTSLMPRGSFLGFDWSKNVYKKTNLFMDVEHYFSDDWKLTGKLNHVKNNADTRYGYIGSSATGFGGLSTRGQRLPTNWQNRFVNEGEQIGVQVNLNGTYSLLGRKHDFFSGYTYSYESTDADRRQFNIAGQFDPFTFGGQGLPEPNWNQGSGYWMQMDYTDKIISNALMLGTRFNATDRLHVIAGTRYTMWRVGGIENYHWFNGRVDNDPSTYYGRKRNRFVPYLGITFDLDDSSSLYASYTSIFKPNSAKDRDGRYLKPVLGNNIEVGWKAGWMDGRLNTTLALFNIDQKNRSVSVRDPISNRSYNQPIGNVRSRGLDAEVSGEVAPGLKVVTGYTYNNSKYRQTESSRYTAGMNYSKHTPRHMLRMHGSYRLPGAASQWTVGAGMSVQSKTNSLWNVPQGGYAIFNANVQYQINPNMELALIVKNLGDRVYFENNRVRTTGINNFYGQPRTVTLNFLWKM